MKTIAIMQPYFLPYIGYFQLMNAVDEFVLFDDVPYINKGWINRNRILVNGTPWMFTVPLKNASQNVLIKDLLVADNIASWREKFLKTVARAYSKASCYETTMALVEKCTANKSSLFIDWLDDSLCQIANILGITVKFKRASTLDYDRMLKGQDRILAICEKESASTYINPINGQNLYSKAEFERRDVLLKFIQANHEYVQFEKPFISRLSMLDVLMFNEALVARNMLAGADFI